MIPFKLPLRLVLWDKFWQLRFGRLYDIIRVLINDPMRVYYSFNDY